MATDSNVEKHQSARGKTWSLILCTLLFAGVFVGTYRYVFPRFGQEPLSSTCSLRFHQVLPAAEDGCLELSMPNGVRMHVEAEAVLDATHFSAFRSQHSENPARITLILSDSGQEVLGRLRQNPTTSGFVAILNKKPIALVQIEDFKERDVAMQLNGVSSADANEVAARLTE